jgi:hypothetical protein
MNSTDADALILVLFALTLAGGIGFMAFRSLRASAHEALEKPSLGERGPAVAD